MNTCAVHAHACELDTMAVQHINEREYMFALDVGCGAGHQSIRLAQHGASVMAVDVRDMSNVIGNALANIPELAGQVTFTQCDMRQLHELPILLLADVIVCQRAIHCLPYREAVKVISTMRQLLAPCGRLYLSASGMQAAARHEGEHAPVCVYSEEDLSQLIIQGGLLPEAVFTSDCGSIKAVARRS